MGLVKTQSKIIYIENIQNDSNNPILLSKLIAKQSKIKKVIFNIRTNDIFFANFSNQI